MTIVRTADKCLGGITPDEAEKLKVHSDKWIANAMSTEPVVPERLIPAIKALYATAGLKEPTVVVVPSPLVMAFAGGFAAAILWARKNPTQAVGAVSEVLEGESFRRVTHPSVSSATSRAAKITSYSAIEAASEATEAATDPSTWGEVYGVMPMNAHVASKMAISRGVEEITNDAISAVNVAALNIRDASLAAASSLVFQGATDFATREDVTGAVSQPVWEATTAVSPSEIDEAVEGVVKRAVKVLSMVTEGAIEEAAVDATGGGVSRDTDSVYTVDTDDAIFSATDNVTRMVTRMVTKGATDPGILEATADVVLTAMADVNEAVEVHSLTNVVKSSARAVSSNTIHAIFGSTRRKANEFNNTATDHAIRAAIEKIIFSEVPASTSEAEMAIEDVVVGTIEETSVKVTNAVAHVVSYRATLNATVAAADTPTRVAVNDLAGASVSTTTNELYYSAVESVSNAITRAAEATTEEPPAQPIEQRLAGLARTLGREFGINPDFLLECSARWWAMYQGGNMWCTWDSYVTAFRDVLGLVLPEHTKYRAWETCAIEGGFRVMHEEFCIVCDRPEILTVDEQNRPHNSTGPSHRWRDGWSLYYWHGVKIPDELSFIIHSPQKITVADIESQTNSELRRVMIDRYGPARYVVDSGATVVQELPADYPMVGLRTARLLRKEVPEDEPIIYVDLLNSTPEPDGTVKRYMLRVDPKAYGGAASRNVHAAAASTWRNGTSGELTFPHWRDYAPMAES